MKRAYFVSLRHKIFWPLISIIFISHIFIYTALSSQIDHHFANTQLELHKRNLKALNGAMTTSYHKLLEVAQTISLLTQAVGKDQFPRHIEKVLESNFSLFQAQGMLDSAALYGADGQLIYAWGDTSERETSAIRAALENEFPVRGMGCQSHCFRFLAIPQLTDGKVNTVMVLGRRMHDMLLDFKQLTGVDIGIAKASQGSWSDVSGWQLNFGQMTQRNRNLQILNILSKDVVGFEMDSLYSVEAFGETYDLFFTVPESVQSNESIWVLISEQISKPSFFYSPYGRLLFVLLLSAFILGLSAYFLSCYLVRRINRVQQLALTHNVSELPLNKYLDETDELLDNLASIFAQTEVLHQRVSSAESRFEDTCSALNKEQELLTNLMDNTQSIVLTQNASGHIVSCNEFGVREYGCQGEIVGSSFSELFLAGEYNSVTKTLLEQFYLGHDTLIRQESRSLCREGEHHYLSWIHSFVHSDDGNRQPLILSIGIDVTEKRKAEERLAWLAFHDPVTAIANKRLFLEQLPEMLLTNGESGRSLAVLCCDFEGLRDFSMPLSASDGDHLMNSVTKRLAGCLRDRDLLSRFADDLFMIVLQEMKCVENASLVAQKILSAFDEPFVISDKRIAFDVCIGVSLFPEHGKTVAELVNSSEVAMYHARQGGKRGYHIFTSDAESFESDQSAFMMDFSNALEAEQLQITYQPVVDMQSEKVVAAEARVYWQHPVSGTLDCNEFIDHVFDASMGSQLNESMLFEIFKQRSLWQFGRNKSLRMVIRLSRRQLQDPVLVTTFRRGLALYQLPAELIEIRLDGEDVLSQRILFQDLIRQIAALGLSISIDSSSHEILGSFIDSGCHNKRVRVSVDTLLNGDKKQQDFVRKLVLLGREMDMVFVASGVVSSEQVAELLSIGCTEGVGSYYSTARTPAQFSAYVESLDMLAAPEA